MSSLNKLLQVASLATFSVVGTSETNAATMTVGSLKSLLNPSATGMDIAENGKPLLAQVAISSGAGRLELVSAVSENFNRSCMISSGPSQRFAFNGTVYEHAVNSHAINSLFAQGNADGPTPLDLSQIKYNAPYIEIIENKFDGAFVRIQAGFPIENAKISIGTQLIDASNSVELSDYTVKITNPEDVQAIKDAYLSGEAVNIVALSEKGTTMAFSFKTDGTSEDVFEKDCLENIDNIQLAASEFFSITTTPLPVGSYSPELVQSIIGQQCVDDKTPEDVAEVHLIERVTGATLPFRYALKMQTGEMVVADYYLKDRQDNEYVSASRMQSLENHSVSSCAGKTPVDYPPIVTRMDTPTTSSGSNTPVTFTPVTPKWVPPVYYPPISGCVRNCGYTPTTPELPEVPLDPSLLYLGTALAIIKRKSLAQKAADLFHKPTPAL